MKKRQNHLKAARIMAGYTQVQLAKVLGKTQSTVSSWENGGLGEARLNDVLKLSKLLGVDIKDLVKEA